MWVLVCGEALMHCDVRIPEVPMQRTTVDIYVSREDRKTDGRSFVVAGRKESVN